MNRVFSVAILTVIIVIGITLYVNFLSPYKPADTQEKYAYTQLVFSVVELGVIFTLLYATIQFAKGQRRPSIKIIFSDTGTQVKRIKFGDNGGLVEGTTTNIVFSLLNDGNNIAI